MTPLVWLAADVGALDPYVPWVVEVAPVAPTPGEPLTVTYRGALAGRPGLTLVYGFDAWQHEAPGGGFQLEEVPVGDLLHVGRRVMDVLPDGGSVATVETPPELRALHLRFEDAETGEIDDRGGLDYGWDAVFPYIGPFLTWNDAAGPTDGVVVSWETAVPGLGVVAHGPDPAVLQRAIGAEIDTLHHVTLSGLPSDTEWYYQVWDTLGRASEVYSFRTAPVDVDTFQFLVIADMQDSGKDGERWADVVAAALGHEDARFVFAPGDLASNDLPGYWWAFFDRARPLFARLPLVPAPGNHDTPDKESNPDTTHYRRYFDLPTESGTEDYYSIRYGSTQLVVLSTEDPSTLEPGGSQYNWLNQTLPSVRGPGDPAWIVTGQHHPAYDASDRFPEEQLLYRPVTALYDGRVDLAVQAHVHLFQRWSPLRFDGPAHDYGHGPHDGPLYLITPTAGSMIFERLVRSGSEFDEVRDGLDVPDPPRDEIEVPSEHGYHTVDVRPDGLTVTTWGIGDPQAPSVPHPIDVVTVGAPASCACDGGPGRPAAVVFLAGLATLALRRRTRSGPHVPPRPNGRGAPRAARTIEDRGGVMSRWAPILPLGGCLIVPGDPPVPVPPFVPPDPTETSGSCSRDSGIPVEVDVRNATTGVVAMQWIDTECTPQAMGILNPSDVTVLYTEVGHVFRFVDLVTDAVLLEWTADLDTDVVVVGSP